MLLVRSVALSVAVIAIGCPGGKAPVDAGALEGEGEGEGEAGCEPPWFVGGVSGAVMRAGSEVASADLDEDANEDLVFLDRLTGTLSMARGGAAGIGMPATLVTALPGAEVTGGRLLASDVDADGDLDLVAGCGLALANGDGTFSTGEPLCTEGRGIVAIDDLDADGTADLLLADPSLRVRLADGAEVWAAPEQAWATLAEVTGDGVADLVVVERDGISVLAGGDIGAATPIVSAVPVVAPASALRIVDVVAFRVDGVTDLAAAVALDETSPRGVVRLRGDQSGTFALSARTSIAAATRLLVVQGDGDPDEEVLALHRTAVMLDGSAIDGFAERALAGTRIVSATVFRPDAAGPRQLALIETLDARLHSLDATSRILAFGDAPVPAVVPAASGPPTAVSVVADAVLAFRDGVLVARIDAPGAGGISPVGVWPPDAPSPHVFVATGDGIARVSDLESPTPALTAVASTPGLTQLMASDWDNDGLDEIVASAEGGLFPFEVTGAGELTPLPEAPMSAFATTFTGDLDGDGLPDLISSFPVRARVRTSLEATIAFDDASPARCAADIDFDGRAELLTDDGVCELDGAVPVCSAWGWGAPLADAPILSSWTPTAAEAVIGSTLGLTTVRWSAGDEGATLHPRVEAAHVVPGGAPLLPARQLSIAGAEGSTVPLAGVWGTFAATLPTLPADGVRTYTPRRAAHVLWGDFDADSAMDLVTVDAALAEVTLTTHPADAARATVAASSNLAWSANGAISVRLEPDGPSRILYLDAAGGLLSALAVDASAAMTATQAPLVVDAASFLRVVDADGNGAIDLLLLRRSDAEGAAVVPVLVESGALGTVIDAIETPPGGALAVGDFDGDGATDLAAASTDAVTVTFDLVGTRTRSVLPFVEPRAPAPSLLAARMGADDADALLVVEMREAQRIDVQTGATTPILQPPYAQHGLVALDVDHDGDDDLLGWAGALYVIENDAGSWRPLEVHGFYSRPAVAASMEDVDGDGVSDLLGADGTLLRGRCADDL